MNGKINDKPKSDDRTTEEQTSDDRCLTKINSWRTAWRSLLTKFFADENFLLYSILKSMYQSGPRRLLCKLVEWQPFPLNLHPKNCLLSHCHAYYRKRGSASYIVREWLLWVVERERETPVTSSISRWNREWSCIWLPRQRVDPMHMHTRRRVLSLHLLSSARSAWQAKTTNSNSCDRAVAQVKYRSTYPNNLGEGTASTEEISKKGIKLILKTIGNRKGDCAWSCSRGQTQPEKICKLQSTNQ